MRGASASVRELTGGLLSMRILMLVPMLGMFSTPGESERGDILYRLLLLRLLHSTSC